MSQELNLCPSQGTPDRAKKPGSAKFLAIQTPDIATGHLPKTYLAKAANCWAHMQHVCTMGTRATRGEGQLKCFVGC